MRKNFYAVKVGRQPGIYTTWAECEQQVRGFPGARYKGFVTKTQAIGWLNKKEDESPVPKWVAEPNKVETEETLLDGINLYTDGSCLKNPGVGGWAAIIVIGESVRELAGGTADTTNNRMEMTAAINGLEALPVGAIVNLHTDSQYLKNAFTRYWLANWKRYGWKTANGSDVLNKDLWLRLDNLCQTRQVKFHWVKGHAGHKYNERCDTLARSEAMKYK